MLNRIKANQTVILSSLIGLFFILMLHFKASYSAIPILLALVGLRLLYLSFKQKKGEVDKQNKWLIGAFAVYFVLFVISLIVHKGRGSELDLASRALLALPILTLCLKKPLNHKWIVYSLIVASCFAGIVAIVQVFGLGLAKPFPQIMHIQSGDIVMSFAIFSFCILFYFRSHSNNLMIVLSLIASLGAMIASILTGTRGAWVGMPFMLLLILWLNRKQLSKWIVMGILSVFVIGTLVGGNIIQQRFDKAQQDIQAYAKNNSSTSLGARFDMWESALLGIQEKPIFGWGLQGVKQMRQQHFNEKKISKYASQFDHAHNQFLQDASARGILGLGALLAIFFVPLFIFIQNLRLAKAGTMANLWGVIGISHILLVMSYCLSQSFLSHTSGVMFYFVGVILFIGLQKNALNSPLEVGLK